MLFWTFNPFDLDPFRAGREAGERDAARLREALHRAEGLNAENREWLERQREERRRAQHEATDLMQGADGVWRTPGEADV